MQWGVEGECGEGGGDEEVGRVWTGGGVLWVADVGRCGGGGFGRVVRRCVAGVVRDGVAVACFWRVLGRWLGLFPVFITQQGSCQEASEEHPTAHTQNCVLL